MKVLLIILFIGSLTWVNSQVPNHFVFGAEAFSKIDIYDIFQDSAHQLHAATDDGLYVYRQNKFRKYENHPEQRGNSFFDFKTDVDGQLYCKNLNGQLFKILESKLELFYQLPSANNGKFHYSFDKQNRLYILNNSFYRVNKDRSIETILFPKIFDDDLMRNFINPSFNTDGSIYCKYLKEDSVVYMRYLNDTITYHTPSEVQWLNGKINDKGKLYIFNLNKQTLFVGKDSTIGVLDSNCIISATPTYNESIKAVADNLLIGMHRSRGFRYIYERNSEIISSPYYLKEALISATYLSPSGTLFLGTFNKGVIVIPNYKVIAQVSNNQYRGIAVTPDNHVYLSTREGRTFEFIDDLKLINESKLHSDRLYYIKDTSYENSKITSHIIPDVIDNIATVKDLFETDFGVLLATNSGINLIQKKQYNPPIYFKQYVNETEGRYRQSDKFKTVAYDAQNELMYFASYKGTQTVDNLGNEREILYKGRDLFSNDIERYNNLMLFGTENEGILVYDSAFVRQLNVASGLLSNRIKKIKIKGDLLFVLFNTGIQIVDLTTMHIFNLGRSEGVNNSQIINFDISADRLWLIENDRFYSLDIAEITRFKRTNLTFTLDSIIVNNIRIDSYNRKKFEHTENEFKFYVDFSDLPRKEEAKYQYQLVGFDTKQKYLSTSENNIEYQSLPPGNYSFQIKITYQDIESKLFIYDFEIRYPFWQRWWFYALILSLFGLIIFAFFQYKLKRQAREAKRINELNSSKLIAIQSQMNPHFVFNALNSIQHLVMKGDKDQSYDYITSFANLVRRTLDYSEQETISVDEEIKLLEVYLSLEKLRFKSDFNYQFIYDDIPDVRIPPMLIQPFIENSLVHGLIHKKGQKQLTITLKVEDVLICTIEDNGIGRAAAAEIKKRQQENHKSFAINAIDNRFEILRSYYNPSIGYSYQDFDTADKLDVTTRLIIRIPFK